MDMCTPPWINSFYELKKIQLCWMILLRQNDIFLCTFKCRTLQISTGVFICWLLSRFLLPSFLPCFNPLHFLLMVTSSCKKKLQSALNTLCKHRSHHKMNNIRVFVPLNITSSLLLFLVPWTQGHQGLVPLVIGACLTTLLTVLCNCPVTVQETSCCHFPF